jgi:hypothetical protein
MSITEQQALEIARRVAEERGWPWVEPVRAATRREFIVYGRETWEVWSNAESRGDNVRVVLDVRDGFVRDASYSPG